MTAEEKCKVLKDLLAWAKMTKEQVIYMQERIYAVRTEQGVMIVKASNPQHALDIVGGAWNRRAESEGQNNDR